MLPGLFHFITLTCLSPQFTHGSEISDSNINEVDENENRYSELENESLGFQMHVVSRLLQDDETCSISSCDSDAINSLRASMTTENVDAQPEEGSGILGRVTGFFSDNSSLFGRLINGIFNRRQEDDPKYPVPTATILPLLSNYSTKFKSLAALIRKESVNDAALSKTPDAIRMMYNISATNMESVATVLDPMLEQLRQHETIDIRTISCNIMQILTVLRDVTVPTIQSTAQLIAKNADMNSIFQQQYNNSSSENSKSSITDLASTSGMGDDICLSESTTSMTSRTIGISLDFLDGSSNDQ